MYAFELAAEFKARSERNVVLVTTASVRSLYHISVTSYKILYDVIVKTFQEKNPNAVNRRYRRNNRGADLVENGDDYSNFDDESPSSASTKRSASMAPQSRRQQQQQTTVETVAGLEADEQTLNDFLTFLAHRKAAESAPTTTTTPAATTTTPTTQLKLSKVPQAPYLPGFLGPDGEIIPIPTRSTTPAAAKPTPAPRPQPPAAQSTRAGGLDLSELTRRPLRKVGDGSAAPEPPKPAPKTDAGGIDLSELQRRPLRKVTRDENGNVVGGGPGGNDNNATGGENKPPLFPRNLKPVQTNVNKQPEPAKDQLTILGRRVESSSIPGEESMSFSDRIKVASKMTLKQTHAPRSPGGTPRRERKQQESEFVVALRHKFRNVNRDSLNDEAAGTESETEWN